MKPFWIRVNETKLAQGDLLSECLVPVFNPDYGKSGATEDVAVSKADLVVVTQSCDLANAKVTLVAMCPISSLGEFEETNPSFKSRGRWEEVRKGRIDALHLLASPTDHSDNRKALVVDFGRIFSLPHTYLTNRAAELGDRWRLDSPFLEHFSQAFARFFMRVGLPSSIPPYK
jgi:hypothetical protein